MRDFFIKWFERIVNVVIILAAIGLVLGGLVAIFASPQGILVGLLQALLLWIFGGLYLILIGGAVYIGLGVYNSTRRTAEAVERLASKDN